MRRILPVIFVILLIFASAHYFIFLAAGRSIENDHWLELLMVLGFISLPLGFFSSRSKYKSLKTFTWIGYIWMGVFTFLFFFSFVDFLIRIFYEDLNSVWILQSTAVITAWSLFRGLSDPRISVHQMNNDSLKGLKLVQLSDLHVGMLYLNAEWLKRVVERTNLLNPDIIAITGDLVEGEVSKISPQLECLKNLKAKHKYYITGNHEYIHGASAVYSPWEERLKDLGFTILHNSNEIISHNGSNILMAGVPDRMIRRFLKTQYSLPDKALKTYQNVDYRILLAHQPGSAKDIKTEKCDLMLCGHTHGGQIFPFHFFVRMANPAVAGFKKINSVNVFTHSGTGFWGPPMRWLSKNEIVLLEWQ